jgi:hypothetical protein
VHASPRSAAAGLLAVAIGALLAGCHHKGGGTEAAAASTTVTATTATTTTAQSPSVTVDILKDHADSPPYDVAVQVPVLHGVGNTAQLNQLIRQPLKDRADQFVSDVRQQGPPPAGVIPNDPTARNNLTCTSETRLVDARLASFRLTCSAYNAGAAHPDNSVTTFNLDLVAGRLLSLDDVFQPGSGYLAFLSQRSVTQLDARFGDDAAARQGAGASADNFSAWSLTPTTFEITFGDSQVGPHAIGTPTVAIDLASLKPYLRHPGPLDVP